MVFTTLTSDEEKIRDQAMDYVRDKRNEIIADIAGDDKYIGNPALSIFMAGSPGAGKTETSKILLSAFDNTELQNNIIRIDPDELRSLFSQYRGGNAHIFQQPITIATNYVFNYAIKTNKHILVDGTFSNYDYAYQNVTKSLKKNRVVIIMYTYVDPILAWEFTKAREAKEGRKITKEVFIDALFGSLETVKKIKHAFGKKVAVYVLIRDYIKDERKVYSDVESIDKYINIHYSKSELANKI